jgi:hypothetical protein
MLRLIKGFEQRIISFYAYVYCGFNGVVVERQETKAAFLKTRVLKKRPASHSRSLKFFNVVFSKELIPIARSQNFTSNLSSKYCSSQHTFFFAI